ncbi:MAG: hypothetical protein N3D16_11910, partial [Anaerolineales bacterium]|nr:hypothetical protein [Anaerolineales bacterium]
MTIWHTGKVLQANQMDCRTLKGADWSSNLLGVVLIYLIGRIQYPKDAILYLPVTSHPAAEPQKWKFQPSLCAIDAHDLFRVPLSPI